MNLDRAEVQSLSTTYTRHKRHAVGGFNTGRQKFGPASRFSSHKITHPLLSPQY